VCREREYITRGNQLKKANIPFSTGFGPVSRDCKAAGRIK